MAVMIEGGCSKCGRACSTGINSHIIKDGKIIESALLVSDAQFDIICYSCYDRRLSKRALRDEKLDFLLKKRWYEFWK